MRVSGKKQDNAKQNNGLSCSTNFQKIKSKYISKLRKMVYRNKDNHSTYFTFSVLFEKYKRGEVEIRHVPSCYNKSQLPSLTSTQLLFLDEVHVKKVCGPPSTSRVNECKCFVSKKCRRESGCKNRFYETNNQPKKATFK